MERNRGQTLVALEVALDRKGSVASHALERLLARVAVAVDLQTAWARKGFATAWLQALVSVMLRT
jgi:hypothetical protein